MNCQLVCWFDSFYVRVRAITVIGLQAVGHLSPYRPSLLSSLLGLQPPIQVSLLTDVPSVSDSYGVHRFAGFIRFRRYRLQSDRTTSYKSAPYVTSAFTLTQTFQGDHMLLKQFRAVSLHYDRSVPSSGPFQDLSCSHWLY